MAKKSNRIPFFTCRDRADGSRRYYWQPSKSLRLAGFGLKRLSDDQATAITECLAETERVQKVLAGGVTPRPDRAPRRARIMALPFVYVMQRDDGKVKIGISRDPDRRLSDIGAAQPDAVKLIVKVRVAAPAQVERFLHGLFRRHRVSGEWFLLDPRRVVHVLKGLAETLSGEIERV